MNKLFSLALLLCGAIMLQAQDAGINFEKGDWASVLKKAKAEDKLIFLDAYTSWCGPCKKMERDIFPQAKIADFYNKSFVNVKVNMEKGEGIQLAEKYTVVAYPTLLFLTGEGDVVHRGLGYHDMEQFMSLGEAASDPDQQLMALEARFADGDRNGDLLYNLTRARFESGNGGFGETALAYLEVEENWEVKENMAFILSFVTDLDSKPYQYVLNNRQAFEDQFDKKTVDLAIEQKIRNEIFSGEGRISLEDIDRLYKEGIPDKAAERSAQFRLDYYQRAGDLAKYIEAATNYLDNFDLKDADIYNEVAWVIFENAEDERLLNKAVKWTEKSIALSSNSYNNDTLAALHYKLGNKKSAKKYAKAAIKLAKEEGVDYTATAELMEKIKVM